MKSNLSNLEFALASGKLLQAGSIQLGIQLGIQLVFNWYSAGIQLILVLVCNPAIVCSIHAFEGYERLGAGQRASETTEKP